MPHPLQSYLNIQIDSDPTIAALAITLPAGWLRFANLIVLAYSVEHRIPSLDKINVAIRDGVLYIECENVSVIFKLVMRTILQDSAKTCMICGKLGKRRKEQIGKPALCRTHYLEYINAISED